MRRLSKKHNIPAYKLYVHIIYDRLDTAFAGFLHRQREPIDNYESLRPVEAKICVADHDASVASIDVSTLETRIEEEMVKIREAHVMTSETITRLWKARSLTP